MAEDFLRQSPLAHLHLAARAVAEPGEAGVTLRERPFGTMATLRGNAGDPAFVAAVEGVVGVAPPREPLTVARAGERAILWLGPDEWLVTGLPAADLAAALTDLHAAATETGESMTVIELAGPRARDVLAKGCALDLHARAFPTGRVVRTLVAKSGVILHATGEPFDVYVHRSFSDYLWRWLEDAGLEYGVAVLAP